VRRIDLDLAAEPRDTKVNGAIERFHFAMRRRFQEPVALQRRVRVFGEQLEQVEFAGSQRLLAAVGRVTGTWSEAAYKVSGNITGRMVGNNISAVAQGDSFNADLAVTTTANRMMVTMTPKATYVVSVKMAFSRAGR